MLFEMGTSTYSLPVLVVTIDCERESIDFSPVMMIHLQIKCIKILWLLSEPLV
jgi:hypothetical protein